MYRRFRTALASLALAGSILAGGLPASAHEGDYSHVHHALSARTSGADVAPLYGNLGTYSMPIGATELAQAYFDEGLNLAYGFNHAEAIRSFQDALTLDPSCTMCAWGIALALGPNINAPMDPAAVPEAYAALQLAQLLARDATPKSRRSSRRSRRATARRRSPIARSSTAPMRRPCASWSSSTRMTWTPPRCSPSP